MEYRNSETNKNPKSFKPENPLVNFKDMEYFQPKNIELGESFPSFKDMSAETIQAFKNRDKITKIEREYFPQTTKIWKEYETVDGVKDGFYKELFFDGSDKIVGNFVNGLSEGIFIENDENHNIFSRSNYKKGKLEGEQKRYYPSGNIQKIFVFKNGNSTNHYEMFSENGTNLTRLKHITTSKISEKLLKLELLTHYKIRELTLLKNTLSESKIESILSDNQKKKYFEEIIGIVF
jgi:antitoxin component YwqK of YwqJK toxin-antitoxin module